MELQFLSDEQVVDAPEVAEVELAPLPPEVLCLQIFAELACDLAAGTGIRVVVVYGGAPAREQVGFRRYHCMCE